MIECDDLDIKECDDLEINPSPKRRKSLLGVSRKQLLCRTDNIMEAVVELAQKENVKASQILGLLLTSCDNPDVGNIGKLLWDDNLDDSRKLPINSTLALYTDCRLGRDTYMKQRKIFKSSGLDVLPPWINLRRKENEMTPHVPKQPD